MFLNIRLKPPCLQWNSMWHLLVMLVKHLIPTNDTVPTNDSVCSHSQPAHWRLLSRRQNRITEHIPAGTQNLPQKQNPHFESLMRLCGSFSLGSDSFPVTNLKNVSQQKPLAPLKHRAGFFFIIFFKYMKIEASQIWNEASSSHYQKNKLFWRLMTKYYKFWKYATASNVKHIFRLIVHSPLK